MPAPITPESNQNGHIVVQILIGVFISSVMYMMIKSLFKSSSIDNNISVNNYELTKQNKDTQININENQLEKQEDEYHILYWSYAANQEELSNEFKHYEHHRSTQVPVCLQKINKNIMQNEDLLAHIENDKNKLLQDIQNVDNDNDKDVNYSTFDVMNIFKKWLEIARTYQPYFIKRANAVCLSTIDINDMYPQSRFVLLKQIALKKGLFIFYTNYNSNKAKQIESMQNKCASMTFYWHILFCSVRITGHCCKLDKGKSDLYWKVRPKKCKLSAITSQQSQTIGNKQELNAKYDKVNEEYMNIDNDNIPRPEWGGYQLKANKIEFWKGDSHRFHDRIEFRNNMSYDDLWIAARLQP